MTMNRKKLIILAAAAVGMLVLYFGISWYTEWNAEQETAKEAETLKITDLESSDISRLTYTDGSSKMSFYRESEEWYYSGDKSMEVDQDTVTEILDTFCQLNGTRKLEDSDKPEVYGLDEPAYEVVLTDSNGAKSELKIGDMTGISYYLTADNGETVYIVDSAAVDAMLFDKASFEKSDDGSGEEDDGADSDDTGVSE